MSRAVVAALLESNPAVVVVGEAVAHGGLDGTFTSVLSDFEGRIFETPIADRGTVAFAVGLALAGKRPIVELSSSQRLSAALEALEEAAAIAAGGEFPVPLVVQVPLGYEAGPRIDRPMIASVAAIPGLRVLVARDAEAAAGLLRTAISGTQPCVLFIPRTAGRARDAAPMPAAAAILREGAHATVLAFGAGVDTAWSAAEVLASEGIEIDVIDLVAASPIDAPTIEARVRATGRLLIADGGDASFARELTQIAVADAFECLEAPPAVATDTASLVTAVHAALQF